VIIPSEEKIGIRNEVMSVSKRLSLVGSSPTLAITAKAKKMKQEGIDIIGFGAGEPDFDTPLHIKEAAKKALDEGFTKYTPASGIKELKEAICRKFKEDNNLDFSPEEILISCGAKHSIFNAILALCDEGDEVILPSPYWVSYPEMIKVAGAKAVILQTTPKENFKITPQKLEEAITEKTKLLIFWAIPLVFSPNAIRLTSFSRAIGIPISFNANSSKAISQFK